MSHRVTLLIFALVILLTGRAWAHAFPDHSEPKVGSIIPLSPEKVKIWFDGDLEPAFSVISVTNAKNVQVDNKDGHVNSSNASLLEVSVPHLPSGQYRVLWNVAARDGHRTSGDFTFTVK